MLEIKKLGEKTIRIADTATGRSYTGSATYKASSVGGDTVCLQSIYEDNEPVFVARVADITIDGAAQTDISACMVALNAFIGSFNGAATVGGGGGVSPAGETVVLRTVNNSPLVMNDYFGEAKMSDVVDALNKGLDPSPLFSGEAKVGIVVFRGLKKIGGTMSGMMRNTYITHAEFPDLERIDAFAGNYMFEGVPLREVSFPKVKYVGENVLNGAFGQSHELKKATVSPAMIAHNPPMSPIPAMDSAEWIEELTITGTIEENSSLQRQTRLKSNSVKHVLESLSTKSMGKTIQFGNLTIGTSDPNRAAIQQLIAQRSNWNIMGLTV